MFYGLSLLNSIAPLSELVVIIQDLSPCLTPKF